MLCYVLTEVRFVPKPLMSCAVVLIWNERSSSSVRGTWHTPMSHCLWHAITLWDILCSGSSPNRCTKFLRGFPRLLQVVRCQLLKLGHHYSYGMLYSYYPPSNATACSETLTAPLIIAVCAVTIYTPCCSAFPAHWSFKVSCDFQTTLHNSNECCVKCGRSVFSVRYVVCVLLRGSERCLEKTA